MMAIQFDRVTFQYRAQSEPTLHEVTLTIQEGEKVLIVGPSGSGKSTLAHCINGLVPHYYPGKLTGSVRIMGEDLAESSLFQLSQKVGTVLQDPDGQFVGMTVAEDIAFQLENMAVPREHMLPRVTDAARSVGMDKLLDASPHELSGGQKQRTSLAGVMASEASILLFDEPLANLDPEAGKLAIELIDRIHRETGKTIVIVEHRLEDVLHRSIDRVIVVGDGRIVGNMTPGELLASGLLAEMGIREPLYVTALKYAGIAISPELQPERVDALKLGENAAALRTWYEGAPASTTQQQKPPLLEIEQLRFGYDEDRPILDDVSLRIGRGELVSIVGRNGAGKSTLSKLICGFHRPSSGMIRYNGKNLADDTIKERAERIGFVMQNPNHMISKTIVLDEVAIGLRTRGLSEKDVQERVHEALGICGLYPMRNWPIAALSFGQKKRVTIAAILTLNPDVLILDEPTAGQDFRHYNEIMEFLLGLVRLGKSVIVITHDMHLMMEYAERTIVLADGRVIANAAPGDVLTNANVIRAASLKETSLQALAVQAGLPEPSRFVRTFIEADRRRRNR